MSDIRAVPRVLLPIFFICTTPALCEMTYHVSVYNDASTDGSTLFATSTSVDNSVGCSAHGSYITTSTLIFPSGAQSSNSTSGMVSYSSMAIGASGTYTATAAMQFYCGCFGHLVGGGAAAVLISIAYSVTSYENSGPTLHGWVYTYNPQTCNCSCRPLNDIERSTNSPYWTIWKGLIRFPLYVYCGPTISDSSAAQSYGCGDVP